MYFKTDKKQLVPESFDFDVFNLEHAAIQAELNAKASSCRQITRQASFRKKVFLIAGSICLLFGLLFFCIDVSSGESVDPAGIMLLSFGVLSFLLVIGEALIKKSIKKNYKEDDLRLVALVDIKEPSGSGKALSFMLIGAGSLLYGGIFPETLDLCYYNGDEQCLIKLKTDDKTAKWAFKEMQYAVMDITNKTPILVRLKCKK